MKKLSIFSLIAVFFTFSSCIEYKDVKFEGIQDAKILKIEKGGKVSIAVDVKMNNPNNYNIKVRPSKFTLSLPDKEIGTVKLNKSVKLIKNSNQTYTAIVNGKLNLNLKNGLSSVLGWALRGKIELGISGKLKISAKGLMKNFPIEETYAINPSKLGLGKIIGK